MRSRRSGWKRSCNSHYGLALFHSRDNGAAMYPPSPPYKIYLKEKKEKDKGGESSDGGHRQPGPNYLWGLNPFGFL